MTVQELIKWCKDNNISLDTPIGNRDHFGDILSPTYMMIIKNHDEPFIDLNIPDRGEEPD